MRSIRFLISLGATMAVAAVLAMPAAAQPDRLDVIIAFRAPPGAADEALVRAHGGQVRHAFTIVPAIAASLPANAIAALEHNPLIERIEPDIAVEAVDIADQSAAEVANAWGVDRLDAEYVWPGGNSGQGVALAVVDTGSGPHPDLNVTARVTCVGGPCQAGGNDDNGHGTHVAGSAAALLNGSGVAGAAPGVTLYSVKVLNSSGGGTYSDVIAGLQWAVNNGAKIANFSLGSSKDPGTTVRQAFDNASAAGVLVVAAAGNSGNVAGNGNNIIYPARYDSVVAVGATTTSDARASFSSTGPDLELMAPGASINSTYLSGGYRSLSGTSMASPHVAGAAALVWTANPGWSNAQVRGQLTSTAKDLGAGGRDSRYGFGLVNPLAALGIGGHGF